MFLILAAYITLGCYLIRRLPWNDSERSYLDVDHIEMARRYREEFGEVMPRRMPFRLPGEYLIYAWVPRHRPALGRVAALIVSSFGVYLMMAYASHLAGPRAGLIAGLIVLSSPTLVSLLCSASYVAPVATLWVGGWYALDLGWPSIALGCAVLLALLRASAWGMSLALLAFLPYGYSLPAAWLLIAYLWGCQREVVLSQGWARLIRREPCPVWGIPQDGWHYGFRVLVRRYEGLIPWVLFAVIMGVYSSQGARILAITAVVFVATHLPRALIRPKWTVGYVPEFLLVAAVGVSALLAHATP